MRLFIALDLDHEGYFKQIQEQIPKDLCRATFPKEFHITLKFLGEVSEAELKAVKSKLSQIKFKSLTFKTTSLELIPDEKRFRVLYVNIDPAKEVEQLQEQIEAALKDIGKPPHPPHITICRVKNIHPKDRVAFVNKIKQIKLQLKEFKIDKFHLVQSVLAPEGPKYQVVHSFRGIEVD